MKKNLLTIVFMIFINSLFATEIPEQLYGIWEGKDRYVFFDKNQETDKPQIIIFLKEYYGWYVDRTAEPVLYSEENKRIRNNGTTREPVIITMDFLPIEKNTFIVEGPQQEPINIDFSNYKNYEKDYDIPDSVKNAFQIELTYSKYQINKLPVCIIDNKMYLNFYVQAQDNKALYRGNITCKGLSVNDQIIQDNIGCWYIDSEKNKIYDVRYWKTDMDYDPTTKVSFVRPEITFTADRHLKSADCIYSSVSGRSRKIRNPQPGIEYNQENYIFNTDNSLIVPGQEKPYLVKLADSKTLEDLFRIVKETNSKRKPDPAPLFPPSNLDWHWDVIDMLEKDNQIIQEVRKRQREFGPRSH